MIAPGLSAPPTPLLHARGATVGWATSSRPAPYLDAMAAMDQRVEAIASGDAEELVWLLEHPPLYTAGVSARADELLDPGRFPVHASGRGGRYTYHGPGQRIAYVMLDLRMRGRDVHAFVRALEFWIADALETFGVVGVVRPGRVGVWVERSCGDGTVAEDKIAAIGVKLRRWISFHGVSLNVEPDLDHFGGIVPCGIADHGVTSLVKIGRPVTMDDADAALAAAFVRRFGPIETRPAPI